MDRNAVNQGMPVTGYKWYPDCSESLLPSKKAQPQCLLFFAPLDVSQNLTVKITREKRRAKSSKVSTSSRHPTANWTET